MKTIKKISSLVLILTAIIASSFQLNAQTVRGNKNVIVRDYAVDNFDAIDVGSAFNVTLRKGDTPNVKVETDENLQDQIILKIKGSTLFIGSKGMNSPTKLKIDITFTNLKAVAVSGAAKLMCESLIEAPRFDIDISGAAKSSLDLNTTLLKTDVSGAANLTLQGHSETHTAEVSGAANMDALKLITINTNVKVSGAAKAKITATENISSDVSGAGSLYYFENNGLQQVKQPGKVIINIKGAINEEAIRLLEVNESGDSTRVKIGNVEVTVQEGKGASVTIGTKKLQVDEEGNIKLNKKDKKSKFNGHWAGLLMGINGLATEKGKIDMPAGAEFLDLKYEKSINVHCNMFEQNISLGGENLGLVTGLGIEWNNYRFADNMKLDRNANPLKGNYLDDKNYTKSKLVVTHLNVPLIIEFQTNPKSKVNSFHIATGVIGGLRIGSYTKMVYENGKSQNEKQRDDFHINPLKADAMLRIGWGKINLYGTYALTPMFRENRVPELYPFSLGLFLISL